jgi:hypothetical protein
VVQSYTPFTGEGEVAEAVILDPQRFLDLLDQIAVVAECDEENVCDW